MTRLLFAVPFAMLMSLPAQARENPRLVPPGWTQEYEDAGSRTRRFVSPDNRSSLTSHQSAASRGELTSDMDRFAFHEGERITYQRRGRSWIAVSGYRGNQIFYRKSNLACGGTRWNSIELLYPRENKLAMDAIVTHIAHGMTDYSNDCF